MPAETEIPTQSADKPSGASDMAACPTVPVDDASSTTSIAEEVIEEVDDFSYDFEDLTLSITL